MVIEHTIGHANAVIGSEPAYWIVIDVYFADSMFFRIFNFEPVIGDIETALYEPFSMVITQTIATKYFNKENPFNEKTCYITILMCLTVPL